MWCIGQITVEYRQRMEAVLALYARPYNPQEPVVCLDEKSKQLLAQTRKALPLQPGAATKEDYEYRRAGTRNIFVAVEPKGGRRRAEVTARRTKADFVCFVQQLVEGVYRLRPKGSFGFGQPQHPFPREFCRGHGRGRREPVPGTSGVSLHAKARQLAEHGRD